MRFDSLLSVPENGDFWEIKYFYSRLKDNNITQCGKIVEDYISCLR